MFRGGAVRINPRKPIPGDAIRVHGITDSDVRDCPTFASLAEDSRVFLEGCDLSGYNIRMFDVPLLR